MTASRLTVERLGPRGLVLMHGVRHQDVRGHLRKVLVTSEARGLGVDIVVDEVLTTHNREAGTVRGLHYQVPPFAQAKTLWVTSGAIHDIVVDLREDHPTYGVTVEVPLSAHDDLALHVPPGMAHGYQTLEQDTGITYLVEGLYSPTHSRTLLWNDTKIAANWPRPVTQISEADTLGREWPPL